MQYCGFRKTSFVRIGIIFSLALLILSLFSGSKTLADTDFKANQSDGKATQSPGDLWQPKEGRDLLGQPAPEFQGLKWLSGQSYSMASLRGHVVLIRFWLAGCPLCVDSADTLNDIYKQYSKHGLVVLGIHHPKSKDTRNADVVRQAAAVLKFDFPVAMDNQWQTINRFWLTRQRSFTSATLLIDKRGTIIWVHDGGVLGEGSPAVRSLRAKIESALAKN